MGGGVLADHMMMSGEKAPDYDTYGLLQFMRKKERENGKMMKKVLAVTMMAMVLAGCSQGEAVPASNDNVIVACRAHAGSV